MLRSELTTAVPECSAASDWTSCQRPASAVGCKPGLAAHSGSMAFPLGRLAPQCFNWSGERPAGHTGVKSHATVASVAFSRGQTSTTPYATAHGTCDTIFIASSMVGASITAKPATGSCEVM